MTLLRAADLHLSFGSRTIFDGLTLVIEESERVGLVGVNGSGKSSLMKILSGAMTADRGEIQMRRGTTVSYLSQEPEFPPGVTVASELGSAHAPLREAHAALAARVAAAPADEQPRLLDQLAALAVRIEHLGGWDTAHQARTLLDRLGVTDWERPVAELSGGTRKRVALARALLSRPDLLLLDEPTNHLDADTVDWLEEELDAFPGALLLVTHDRYFLDDLVDRIVEISPGRGLTSFPGNYQAYLEQKLAAEEQAARGRHKRDRWIAQEVAWLRRGVEARRTKSKARIQRAQRLLAERGPAAPRVAALTLGATPRLGRTVIEAEHVHKRFGDRVLLADTSFILQRGERIGIVGPNGVGKTTFLRVVLGELAPDGGLVVIGKNTRIAYYDQQRAQLDPEKTVLASASDADPVEIGGKLVPLRDYLDDLLFPVPMQRMQVKALSGGERNRLLLARLFLQGANVLVLDEPTNDLDIVTLNVLEELLLGFDGSVLLVTHDRYFLDKVATSILAFEGRGRVVRYPGNYESYLSLRPAPAPAVRKESAAVERAPAVPKARKLTFKERLELEGMDARLQAAEARKSAIESTLSDPASYGGDFSKLSAELEAATAEVEALYARWQELEDLGK